MVQSVPIAISAEAYNVAVELHFPKGSGAVLNFGTLRVFEEKQTTLSLRNKGKYPMNYNFVINHPKLFTVTPNTGSVAPSDKPSSNITVTITFKSGEEVDMVNSTEIYCHVTDPHTNNLIAKIPVNISVRSVFSKYSISPERGINFGPFLHGTKKSRSFSIKNDGEFEFK